MLADRPRGGIDWSSELALRPLLAPLTRVAAPLRRSISPCEAHCDGIVLDQRPRPLASDPAKSRWRAPGRYKSETFMPTAPPA